MKRALLLLALGVLPAAGYVENADRSLAVFPRQEIPLRFDHGQHLRKDMKCVQCHDVDRSRRASDRNIPPESSCTDCHDIEAAKKGQPTDPPASCQTCHPGFDPTVMPRPRDDVFPDPNLKFDHVLHLNKGVACETCHGNLTDVKLATRQQLPKMETCLTCHRDGGEASGRCSTCHLESPDGTLVTAFAAARLVPTLGNPFGVAHGPGYERTHGPDAQERRAVCSSCHSEGYCLTCHAGTLKNLKVHPNDWITLHPVPAKQNSLTCNSCHNYQTFCVNCHAQAGIAREVPALGPKGQLTFHPPGWVTPSGGTNTHALQASRNISSCVSCHREETCLQCHATRDRLGSSARVHPLGFKSQAPGLCHRNERVCLTCHSATDSNIVEVCR